MPHATEPRADMFTDIRDAVDVVGAGSGVEGSTDEPQVVDNIGLPSVSAGMTGC